MESHNVIDERGASAVEYGLLIAGIAMIIVLATFALGGVTDSMFSETCSEFQSAASGSATC